MSSPPPPSFNAKPKHSKAKRPPPLELLPSAVPPRRTQRRDIPSRYLESSSPFSTDKRCQSPNVTRTNRPAITPANRPQSTGRRLTPSRRGGSGEASAAERMLLSSGRSLFSSFQGDSYTWNDNRSKLYPSPPRTPRGKTVENSKTTSTTKQEKSKLSDQWPKSLQPNRLSTSPRGSCNRVAIPLQNSSNSIRKKNSVDSLALRVSTTRSPKREQITRPASSPRMTLTASSPRGASIARGLSPSRGVVNPRGMVMRLQSNNNTSLDGRREKSVGDDVHLLKLLHNRLMQWRFVNARANAAISAQKMITEKRLYNASISISKLYDSVRVKRIEVQSLELNLKLISILNKQMGNLEEWIVVERDYMGSLVGAVEALKGSTRCLPVDCAAKVNVPSVKDAICSAVDVMQAMASSICLLLPKVGQISGLAAELGRVNIKEQEMLDVCRELLNTISALQVTECSLKTEAIQLQY
ncbi:unnamed protein product [Eruca vesicaria subsp. sativa]|uniref:Uncharacterized protein n=1 Tax=Eruca vesicaria subsp. sativa TaxID=29727 RepID=A0ABC8JV39_ERUVS|nr:unnamed protein product [Eruca vesicaria subsp. sativa]